MPGHTEASRHQRLDVQAPAEFKDLLALLAAEMMMMILAGYLIARGFAWQVDFYQDAFFEERVDGAIDGSNAHALDFLGDFLEDVLRAERPVQFFKNRPDGPALASAARHGLQA